MKAAVINSMAALLFLFSCSATATAALPDAADRLQENAALESPRQSWLLDHTHTGMGGEFFRAFASRWRQQETGALVISVQESAAAFFGHQISIWAGERLLLQTRFYPSQRAVVPQLAESSASAAAEKLAQWQALGVPLP